MKNLIKLTERAPVALGLTFLSLLVLAILHDGVTLRVMVFSILVCALQLYMAWFRKAYTVFVPIEWMTRKVSSFHPAWLKKLIGPLALLPLIASMSMMMAVTGLLLVVGLNLKSLGVLLTVLRQKGIMRKRYLDKISEYDPQVIVFISGLQSVAYQVNQWLPVLDRLHQKSLILIRERAVYEGMEKTRHPVVFARRAVDMEAVYANAKALKVILYPANPQKNTQSLRHYEYQHFFINHGESDKAVNQSKQLMAYDKLLVGGPMAERRLLEASLPLRPEQVEYVGRPQAELLLSSIKAPEKIKTVLYAPTWEGFVEDVNYSSVGPLGLQLLKSLASSGKYKVLFKPHPYTGKRSQKSKSVFEDMRALCDGVNVNFVEPLVDIHDCMNHSDLIITDISSVLNEYLITNKPIVLCNSQGLSPATLNQAFPSSRAAYVLNYGDAVLPLLADIEQSDSLWLQRVEVRADSLGDANSSAMERFQKSIDRGCEVTSHAS